jgi:hypothetical protein
MSVDGPATDKMMKTPPAKKGFHFAPTAEYFALFIEAATIEEAEAIYHKIKRTIGSTDGVPHPIPPATDDAPPSAPSAIGDLPPTNP